MSFLPDTIPNVCNEELPCFTRTLVRPKSRVKAVPRVHGSNQGRDRAHRVPELVAGRFP